MPTTTTSRIAGTHLNELIGIDELASLLGVSKATVYKWCHLRQIPFIRLGKRSLFNPREVEEWLNKKRVEPIGGPK